MLKYLTFVLFIFFGSSAFSQEETYLIQNSSISVVGCGKLKNWKPKLANADLEGKFIVKSQLLDAISDLKIKLCVNDSLLKKSKIANSVKKVFLKNEIDQIYFTQMNLMILPVMKMAHFTMDVNMNGGRHYAPLILNYKVEENQTISVTGKQTIWLYQFGIVPNDIKECHANDKIELDINFSLIKSANMIAKSD
jgi:hypothetical protein